MGWWPHGLPSKSSSRACGPFAREPGGTTAAPVTSPICGGLFDAFKLAGVDLVRLQVRPVPAMLVVVLVVVLVVCWWCVCWWCWCAGGIGGAEGAGALPFGTQPFRLNQ